MIKEEIKFQSSSIFEGMTSVRAIIKSIDMDISNRCIHKIVLDKSKIDKNAKEVGYFRAVSQKYGFIIEEWDADEIDKITLGSSHGGIICFCSERTIPHLAKDMLKTDGFYVMIQGIEDPYNFGYSIRSLYAVGCDGIILPERNWMTASGVVSRSSAGASELIPMFVAESEHCVEIFHSLGYQVVCADTRTDNVLGKTEIKLPVLLIVGGEKRGISRAVLNSADLLIKIAYGREFNASLSAASATTIFAYEIMRQNSAK